MQEKIKEILNDKKFIKETLIILFIGFIINVLCFFLCSITGHCETINSVLPYLCQNDNSFYSEEGVNNALAVINQKYPNTDIYNKKFFVCYGVHNIWYTYNDYIEVPAYYVYTCPDNMILPTTWSNNSTFENFQFNESSSYIDVSLGNYKRYIVAPRSTSIDASGYYCSEFNGGTVRLFGTVTTHNINNNYFEVTVPGLNYPVYTTSQFSTVDRTASEGYILGFADTIVNPGEFTDLPPLENILNNITNSWNNSTDNTLPNTDNSASVSENLRNFLSTMQGNISNAINNLGSNIKSYFDKIQQKLTDITNAILGGIHNGFATLNQNFKDFFGAKLDAILDKLEDIKNSLTGEDLTMQDLKDDFENTTLYSDYEDITSMANTFKSTFDISEPLTYKIPIHFEDIPSLNYNKTEYIDLDVINPVKSFLRTFMWALCTYSIFITILDAIPNYINGGGDE